MHGISASPGVFDCGTITIADGEHGFVTGSGEVAKGGCTTGNEGGLVVDESTARFQANHGIAGVVEPFGAVFDPEHAVFQVLAIGFDYRGIDVRAHGRRNAEGFPEMSFCGHDLVETAEGWTG